MRDYVIKVRKQLAKSTKDNPGTLPISTYGRRELPNNPASLEDLTERLQEACGAAAVNEESVFEIKKDDVVLITKFERTEDLL